MTNRDIETWMSYMSVIYGETPARIRQLYSEFDGRRDEVERLLKIEKLSKLIRSDDHEHGDGEIPGSA